MSRKKPARKNPARLYISLAAKQVVSRCAKAQVEVAIQCAGCPLDYTAWGDTARIARRQLMRKVKGWGVVRDPTAGDDRDWPYCPSCLQEIFSTTASSAHLLAAAARRAQKRRGRK